MSFYDGSRDVFAFIVRAIGLVLLLFGLWLTLEVLNEAWQLYHEPERIERFAKAIEEGSNIDRSIAPLQIETPDQADTDSTAPSAGEFNVYGQEEDAAAQSGTPEQPQYRLSLSYYIAWVIALLLLLLLARIALGVVRTGGELVLYETQMKRFARELVRETVRGRDRKEGTSA